MRAIIVASLFSAIAFSSAAHAQSGRLVTPGLSSTFVWKDVDASREAASLISAGVHETNPLLLYRLLACAVPNGTKAVVTDGGMFSQDILVVEGEHAGCRGNVPTEFFDMD